MISWRRASWLRVRIATQRAEVERLRSTVRFQIGTAVTTAVRRPWRIIGTVGRAVKALKSGAKEIVFDPLGSESVRPLVDYPDDGSPQERLELLEELAETVDEMEAIEAGMDMTVGAAIAAIPLGWRETLRRIRTPEGSYLGTSSYSRPAKLEWSSPSSPVAVVGPAWFEESFANENVAGSEAVRSAALVVGWVGQNRDGKVVEALAGARERGARTALWTGDEPTLAALSDLEVDRRYVVTATDSTHHLGPVIQPLSHTALGWWQGGTGIRGAHEEEAPAPWRAAFSAARGLPLTAAEEACLAEAIAKPLAVAATPAWDFESGDHRQRFVRMRQMHRQHHTGRALAKLCDDANIEHDFVDPLVTLGMCTNRPDRLTDAISNMLGQAYGRKEIVVVAHGPGFDLGPAREMCGEAGVEILVEAAGSERCLGQVRQRVNELARGEWIAKFDDDDIQGPYYAEDMLWEALMAGAPYVSKTNSLVLTTHDHRLYRGDPARELFYMPAVGGGQLLRRDLALAVGIRPVATLEDVCLLRDLLREGVPMMASDPYHYVYRRGRGSEHNWNLDPAEALDAMGVSPLPEGATIEDFQP